MKSLKLAQVATLEIFSNALIFGVVQISEDAYVCIGNMVENLIKFKGQAPEEVVNLEALDTELFYLYEPDLGITPLDEEDLSDLNILLEVADDVEYDNLGTLEEIKSFSEQVMLGEWLESEPEDERHEKIEMSMFLSQMKH